VRDSTTSVGFSDAMMRLSHFPLPGGFGDARNLLQHSKGRKAVVVLKEVGAPSP